MAKKVIPPHKKAKQNYFWYYRRTTWSQDLIFGIIMAIVGYVFYSRIDKTFGIVSMIGGPLIVLLAIVRYGIGWKENGQYREDKRNGKV